MRRERGWIAVQSRPVGKRAACRVEKADGNVQRLIERIERLGRSRFVRDTITLQAGSLALTVIGAVAFVVVARGLGREAYGVYQLVLNSYGLLMTLNLTGLGPATITRLAEAIGAGDREQVRDLMGFFVQVSLAMAVLMLVAAALFGPALAVNPVISDLLLVYMLTLFLLPWYHLLLLVLQAAREMPRMTLLENAGSLVEAVLKIAVVLLGWGAGGVIGALVATAAVKAAASLILYRRLQRRRPELLPAVGEVLSAARHNSPRPYWRFGFLLAVDKNVVALYTLLPVQALAMVSGEAAAGFLRLGLHALSYATMLFNGILTNLEARLPALAGQGDYARLVDNVRRVQRYLIPIAAGLYGVFALLAPLVAPILGEEYVPAIPVIRVLCLYGLVTGIGGVFGPLYRTLRLMRGILAIKIGTLLALAAPGLWLITRYGEVGGAWVIVLLYALSVALTIALVWPRLGHLAADQAAGQSSPPPA